MIDYDTFQRQVEALMALLKRKLGARGGTLETRLHRAGRRLPKAMHRAGGEIVKAQSQIAHPKLARFLDAGKIDGAFTTLTTHLEAYDTADRRKGAVLGMLGALVFNLILVIVVLVAVLRWQGLV